MNNEEALIPGHVAAGAPTSRGGQLAQPELTSEELEDFALILSIVLAPRGAPKRAHRLGDGAHERTGPADATNLEL